MEIIKKCPEDWMASDPKLERNHIAVDLDTDRVKFGDGKNHWSNLDYTPYIEFANNNKPYVAPEFFGELSSDVNGNDSGIIQKAINAGYNIRFTPGVEYKILSTITVKSNTILEGKGAVLKLPSTPRALGAFIVDNKTKNVVFENLHFEASDRCQHVQYNLEENNESEVPLDYYCSNRECIYIYQETENIFIQNCTFDKVAFCVRFKAHYDKEKLRKNINIRGIWATEVSGFLDGGGETEGLNINNIHIELAPTNKYFHAIYLRIKMKNIKISDFYIKQLPLTQEDKDLHPNISQYKRYGRPFSIYTVGTGDGPCSEPVYISNGEIHASSFLSSSDPYVIYADNIHYINDVAFEDGAGRSIFNHSEQSFGYYTNCTFENTYSIHNGVFSNCKFKLFGNGTSLMYTDGAKTTNKKIEKTIIKDCIIDMNNSANLIRLNASNRGINVPYYIEFKNCVVDNLSDNPETISEMFYGVGQVGASYIVRMIGCDFNSLFDVDLKKTNGSTISDLDIVFTRCSFKSNNSGFIVTPEDSGVNKKYILCGMNNDPID